MSDTAADLVLDVALVRRWMKGFAAAVEEGCDELTRLDAAIGDADHGINMLRGMRAALVALEVDDGVGTPGEILSIVGTRLVTVVGGAAGPIYGTAFRAMGESIDHRPVDMAELAGAAKAGLEGIQRLGAAVPGDKTIVDAWLPAAEAMAEMAGAGTSLDALAAAERAAHQGMLATIPMRARKGRASYLGWRSEGHQDPGATSTHMIFSSLLEAARQGTD